MFQIDDVMYTPFLYEQFSSKHSKLWSIWFCYL